jgi:hypothetical protein
MTRLFLLFLLLNFACADDREIPAPQSINYWDGKTIDWTGTSIPWSFGLNSYPNQVGKALNAVVKNRSISGSAIVFFPKNTDKKFPDGSSGMSATWAQLQKAGFSHPNSYMSTIFESDPDLVVIDHGYNDHGWIIERLGDIGSRDIGTFYGALNTVIDATESKYPNTTILLCTPPNGYPYQGKIPDLVKRMKLVQTAILNIGDHRNIKVWDIMARSGITAENVHSMTTDDVHPNKMTIDSIAKDGVNFILNEVVPKTTHQNLTH